MKASIAKEHLQMAINLEGERASAYCLLAQVLEAQKDENGALVEWESCSKYASEFNPDEDAWKGMADKRLATVSKEKSIPLNPP